MNKEILLVVDAVSNEKGVDKEVIFEALEAALAAATRKKHGEEWDVRVAINRKSGDYDTFRRWKVFADDSTELETPDHELRLDDALELDKNAEPGGSPRSRPSRSWCRRCARPSGRKWWISSRNGSTRWSAVWSSAWIATASSWTWEATPRALFPAWT
jgi:hypothetical protein